MVDRAGAGPRAQRAGPGYAVGPEPGPGRDCGSGPRRWGDDVGPARLHPGLLRPLPTSDSVPVTSDASDHDPRAPHSIADIDARGGAPAARDGVRTSEGPRGLLTVRAARPEDAARVARLLCLRAGTSVDEARQQAPAMIENLPALVIATLTPDGVGADDEDAEALAVPVALSGAFFLPEGMFDDDGWMVTGLLIDPDVRRGGIGRAVLAELVRQVGALQPGAVLQTFVDATHHAALAMHLSVGFHRVEERQSFAGMEMPDGGMVLAVVCPG